jgi:cytochrome c
VAPISPAWSGGSIAGEAGFKFSDALQALPALGYRVWTETALDALLMSPEDFAPGTAMTCVGLPDAKERADLIAYLAATRDGLGRE